ncbi:hypothetical protein BaRGS_00029665 [Batillaria attramentaria]|uniref:Uncharacterized protein n=1 Tax=Batillaria attramentaria TaxID=370345 RepID=A0ABD0JVW3_9CAEN
MAPDAVSREEKDSTDEGETDDSVQGCRKLHVTEKNIYKALMSLLVLMGFAMVISLFALQAYISWKSHQTLTKVQLAKDLPQGMYDLYFDYLEWGPDLDKVDLRVNTTIFVH